MIDLKNLIDFFPYYFKENDSYKVDGKGLLERFLNICGDYFQQHPLADLDAFLENLDVNKTNIIFVRNFWKFFGELPFAQGPTIDSEIFTKTFTGFNLDEAISKATRSNQPYTGKASIDYRRIIQYAVSLFKIRGTEQFFEIMFRLYDLQVTITYPNGESPFEDDCTPRFDLDDTLFDQAHFDKYYRYKQTFNVGFTVKPPSTLTSQTQVLSFANQFKAFIDRFVPFYINPQITVTGWNQLNKVKLSILKPADNPNLLLNMGESLDLEIKVEPLIANNTFPSLAYQVAITEKGATPVESDWSEAYTKSTYTVVAGNKDYHFRAVADPSVSSKVHVTEQYINVQYMIWVDSPRKAEDRILSETKQTLEVVVKAAQYIYTYKDGTLSNTSSSKPAIYWDSAPDGAERVYQNGEAKVTVDYYGIQTFSINSFRTKRAQVYIGATDEYKKELDTLQLKLVPQYLLIQDGGTSPGMVKEDGSLAPGIYGSEDGITWVPQEFKSEFLVTNREGQVQPTATITDINDTTKTYASGDTFIPPTTGTSNYTFKAVLGDKESNTVTLYVKTNATLNTKPTYKKIEAFPNPLQFSYSSGSQTKTMNGTLILSGLTKAIAQNFSPEIEILNSVDGSKHTVNAIFQSYVNTGSLATYSFTYSHTIDSDKGHNLKFYPKDNPAISTTVPVEIIKSTTNVYMQAFDKKDQWTVNDTDPSDEDLSKKRGKDLTFTAKAGAGNNIAKFTFTGSYGGNVTDDSGNSYEVDSDEPISFEVNGNKDITFTAGDVTMTLHLRDFAGIVQISCNPTSAELSTSKTSVKTTITGSTNKSDKFRFTIDGQSAIREIENNGAFEFITSDPGTHTFTAVDDPSQVAYFDVSSNMPTMQVTKDALEWDANDTNPQTFEVLVPSTTQVTIIEED